MRKIRSRIYLYTLLLVFVVLFIMYLLQVVFLEHIYQRIKERDVRETQVEMVQKFDEMDVESAYREIWKIAKENEMYVAIYDNSGREVMTPFQFIQNKPKDSKFHPPYMFENYRRVFVEAKSYMEENQVGTYTYYGEKETELIVVTAIDARDGTFYILTRARLVPVKATTDILRVNFFWGIIVAFLFAGIVAFILAQHISKPVHALSKGAKAVAAGNLDYRVPEIKGKSEIAVLIRDFNGMTVELSKEDKLRKDLLANVSHELRTPLTMIKGYAETMRELTGDNPEKREKQLGIIIEESDRLTSLITDLLDLAQMQSGHVVFRQEQIDFSETVKDIMVRYECFKDKGYHIDVNVTDNVCVTGDKDRLAQVVYNLTDNAINHSGYAKQVSIQLEGGENPRFSVINSGASISQEEIKYIWDRFYHADKSGARRVTGTGIGLSLVREILVHHGFRYGVNSEPGRTEFWIELNRKED